MPKPKVASKSFGDPKKPYGLRVYIQTDGQICGQPMEIRNPHNGEIAQATFEVWNPILKRWEEMDIITFLKMNMGRFTKIISEQAYEIGHADGFRHGYKQGKWEGIEQGFVAAGGTLVSMEEPQSEAAQVEQLKKDLVMEIGLLEGIPTIE